MKHPVVRLAGAAVAIALTATSGSWAVAQSNKASGAVPAKPAPAAAPVSPDPASTSATYGDWVVRCQRVGEGDKSQRLCEVAQSIQVQGQQAPIAQVAFGRVSPSEPLRLTVALPTNITIPGTVTLGMSDKDPAPMPLTWRRCLPGACIADAVPSADELKGFRSATEPGRLTFKDAAGRDVVLPLSFRGLAQAVDALAKA